MFENELNKVYEVISKQPPDTYKTVTKAQPCRVIPSAGSQVRVVPSFLLLPSYVGKQSHLLPQPTEVEVGFQVGVEFYNMFTFLVQEAKETIVILGKFCVGEV